MIALLLAAAVQVPDFRDPPDCWAGPQIELTHCAILEFQQSDDTMSQQLEEIGDLMKRLDSAADIKEGPSYYEALMTGQRTWLAFREAHCSIMLVSGGSIAPMQEYICKRDLTEARIQQLRSMKINPATGNTYFEGEK